MTGLKRADPVLPGFLPWQRSLLGAAETLLFPMLSVQHPDYSGVITFVWVIEPFYFLVFFAFLY
jgi:hypothetical protein